MRIFYVEDQEPLADLGKIVISRAGYEVDHSRTLEESLSKLDHYSPGEPPPYDCAVCDWNIVNQEDRGVNSAPIMKRLGELGVPTVLFSNTYPHEDEKMRAFLEQYKSVQYIYKNERKELLSALEGIRGPKG